jgi:hypothetical protein
MHKKEQIELINEYTRNVIIDTKQPPKLVEYSENLNNYLHKIAQDIKTTNLYGSDMLSILYLIRTFVLSTSTSDKMVKKPSPDIKNWLTSLNKIGVKSVGGYVYIGKLLNTELEIIIKTPKKNDNESLYDTLREYIISYFSINKLRFIIPTFAYTYDIFSCKNTGYDGSLDLNNFCDNSVNRNLYTIMEKVNGNSVKDLFMKKSLNFQTWLEIFIQLLLSLEVAQRETNFTHFDLHYENVMVQTTKNLSYNINIDNITYKIKNSSLTPIIIDFGLSSVKIDEDTFGSFDFPEYGMLNFMVQGYDMYKFLCFSLILAEKHFSKKDYKSMINLFNFYGVDDQNNIITNTTNGLLNFKQTFGAAGSYTKIATYTPLMFYNWIKNNIYIENNVIFEEKRDNYINIRYSNYLKDYNDIFGQIETGVNETIELIKKCIQNNSYILLKYNINILIELNNKLKSDKLQEYIFSIENIMKNNKTKMQLITKDIKMLNKVFSYTEVEKFIPTQKDLDEIINIVLTINIRESNYKLKNTSIEKLEIITKYTDILKPYLDTYYTILEIKTNEFDDWIQNFEKFSVYKFYFKNNLQVERAKRWSITLKESIN